VSREALAGAVPSPNIWRWTATYEAENRAVDPDGVIEAAIRERHDWAGGAVVDIGCGTGFHLPRFADARAVVGVEPHARLLAVARRRVARLPHVRAVAGTAQELPLPDASVDVAHARWAYFFGPGCEPGLAELDRVVRRGGAAFVVDHDATRSTLGRWFRRGLPGYDPVAVERFWSRRGWQRVPLDLRWELPDRDAVAAVLRIELPAEVAEAALAEHDGTSLDAAANLWWRRW
jgi:SAM-dependent methyltransferase